MRKDDKTPKERGYTYVAVDTEMQESLDAVMSQEHCKTRPEALRLLLRQWRKAVEIENPRGRI